MIGELIPDPRAAATLQLNASIDSYFRGGGTVQVLRGFEPVPPRPHQAPEQSSSVQSIAERFQAERDLVQRVKEAAQTLTLAEAVHELGMGRSELHRMSKAHDFFFKSNDKERLRREIARQAKAEEAAKLVTLIKANSDKGLSRHFVAKRLGISPHYLRRLIEEHGIDFPLYGDRP